MGDKGKIGWYTRWDGFRCFTPPLVRTHVTDRWDLLHFTEAIIPYLADIKTYSPWLKRLCISLISDDSDMDLRYMEVRTTIRNLARDLPTSLTICQKHPGFPFQATLQRTWGSFGTRTTQAPCSDSIWWHYTLLLARVHSPGSCP